MTPVSLKMPRRLVLEVSEAARRRGVSRSAQILEALEAFLRAEPADDADSALALAADLAGAFSGSVLLTLDRDFRIYRRSTRQPVPVRMPGD